MEAGEGLFPLFSGFNSAYVRQDATLPKFLVEGKGAVWLSAC